MVGNIVRAALLSAALISIAAFPVFAQQSPTLPPEIVAQINEIAASQSNDGAFGQAVAQIVAANPALAEAIASAATQTRPSAAASLASSLASVVPVAGAAGVVNAIINALPPGDRSLAAVTVVNAYLNSAPPSARDNLTVALAPVLAQQTQTAAGGQPPAGGTGTGVDTQSLQNSLQNFYNTPSQS